ncbi:hypothetical protein M3Y99_01584300 [Aphelenchoides fujianensis]|nr:hypothetical protein M3Y99_01584300 [Aphelenchoides fujianensis]
MSYYSQPAQNPGFQPQGGNPNYGWNQQPAGGPPPQAGGQYHSVPAYNNGADPESGKYDIQFSDATIRAAFVRKVFTLVGIMLGVVAVMCAVPYLHQDTMLFAQQNRWLFWVSYGTFFVTYLALVCCESVRRSFPGNLIMTGIFTLASGWLTMMLTIQLQIESVLLCVIITALSCGSIVLFAMFTKKDLTSYIGVLAVISIFLFMFGLVAVIATVAFHARLLYTVYAGMAALVMLGWLAIDIQMMMGGRKYEISPEDHIFAALQIFLDILQFFWMLLAIFGNNN